MLHAYHREIHYFPTRRSSDLAGIVDEVVHPAVLLKAAADHALRDRKQKPRGGATAVERATTWLPPVSAFALRQRSEEHTYELQSRQYLVCRLLLEKKMSHSIS